MKKISVLILASLVLFSFAACNGNTPAPEEEVLYTNDFSDASTTAFLGDGTARDVTDGAMVVEYGKGFGLYLNHKVGDFKVIDATVGDTYRLTFDVVGNSLEGGAFYVGACVGDDVGHSNYVNAKFTTLPATFTVDVEYLANDAFVVVVNGVRYPITVNHDGGTPTSSWINFTGLVAEEGSGTVSVDNFKLVKVTE